MKAVILAAGYATRLYPLTLDRPKALLPVGGKPMLDHLMAQLEGIDGLDEVYVVTNTKFAEAFGEWEAEREGGLPVEIVDDGTTDEDSRLGAIGDLDFTIRETSLDDDLLVLAGDNLFSESVAGFPQFALAKGGPALGVYDVGDLDAIRRYSAIELDEDDRVTKLEEKPERPRSTLAGIALYLYPRAALGFVREYLEAGNNPDQPGRLVQWLYPRTPVYGWRVPGRWFDVGSKETLAEADEAFTAPG
ncbi:MAG TPA: nucleotidyltransferase family protein [Gaiellaceae bacterium]|nr:nucleotidyltransferase family protein [Gaiellaceae bacterium]